MFSGVLSASRRPAALARPPLDWKSAQWLPVHLIGLGIITWQGQYSGGAVAAPVNTGHIPFWPQARAVSLGEGDSMIASQQTGGPEPRYGVSSMCSPLRRVLVRRPATAGDFAGAGWRRPGPGLLRAQHEAFCELLTSLGCQVEVAAAVNGLVDATYIRDPGLVTQRGGVVFQMAKPARRDEPLHLATALQAAGVPVVARLDGAARADGGDFVWLDPQTLIIGRSYRTNADGVAQMRTIMSTEGVTVVPVDLPHDRGPAHVLHLMSVLSPVADDLAVVFPPVAPVALMQTLAGRGVTIVAVDAGEYAAMACNVLAVRPRQVIMLEGNPLTRRALQRHGCEVHCYDGSDISLKGDGGPTCLTQPLLRAN
jgi:N-dimethylarginine dimethylaminohydrolase